MSLLALHGVALPGRLGATSLAFRPGRLTAIVGPNGAGKSSLLAIAAGLLHPAAGTVTLGGTALARWERRALARARAYLPQRAGVDWPLAVERVVALGLTPVLPAFGRLPPAFSERIERTLAAFDLLGLRDRPASRLSGGELARVMLARAWVGDPEVMLADEATAGLDPAHALDAGGRLAARARDGATVVLATHDLDLALRFADDLVAMKNGRVIAAGPLAEVASEALFAMLYDLPARLRRDGDRLWLRLGH